MQDLLSSLEGYLEEREAVVDYLKRGVQAVKMPGRPLYDRADALVAALSSLPHARRDFTEWMIWPSPDSTRWRAALEGAQFVEGVIALPA